MIYQNTSTQTSIRLVQILKWKFGFGPREIRPSRVTIDKEASQTVQPDLAAIHSPNPDLIQVTWIGHSSFLIQHRGRNLLTDPLFGHCHTPLPGLRIRRAGPAGLKVNHLPPIHDVIISHNHYDHLDLPSVRSLLKLQPSTRFWVPSGLSDWFRKKGITAVRELAWWESAELGSAMDLHAVPAQHFASRGPFDRNHTHWCGWVIRSRNSTIYYAGDTGYSSDFREIGKRFGPMDVSLIPIGAYQPRWIMRSVHVDPAEAVQIHKDVRSRFSIGCHWGTFRLTDEPLNQPPALLKMALAARALEPTQFITLNPGASHLQSI